MRKHILNKFLNMSLLSKLKKNPKKSGAQRVEEKSNEKPKSIESKKIIGKPKTDVYRILKAPHITEKAAALAENNKYIFKVYPRANKTEVQKAVESLYGVKVEKVNIVRIVPKRRRLGRTEGWKGGSKKGFKKAIVTLAKGEKIEIMPR